MTLRACSHWLVLVGGSLLMVGCPGLVRVAQAQAQDEPEEFFRLVANRTQLHDSNYLRASSAVTAFPLGRADAAETLAITTVGVQLDQTVGRQRFELDLTWADHAHQHFQFLDYTAHNRRAAWRWQLGADLQGSLSHDQRQTLNSFADTTNYSQQNLLTQTSTRLNASYRLGAAWRLLADGAQTRETRTISLPQEGETTTQAAGLGVQHVWPSGTALSLTHRQVQGRFLGRTLSAPALLDTEFRQAEQGVSLQWPITGKTSLTADWAHLSRRHPNFAVRNFSGHNASFSVGWQPSGAWRWQARWQRELANFQTLGSNYSVTQRWSVGPVWQASAKTRLSANLQHSRKTYQGSPALPTTLVRADTTRDAQLAAAWQLHQKVSLTATFSQGRRQSTQAGVDYDYRAASLLLDVVY